MDEWATADGIVVYYDAAGSDMVLLDVDSGYCAVIDMDLATKAGAVTNFVRREELGL